MSEMIISLTAIVLSVVSLLISLRKDKELNHLGHINRRRDLRLGWMRQIRDVELSKQHLQTALEDSSSEIRPRLQVVIDRHDEIIKVIQTSLKTANDIDVVGPPDRQTNMLLEGQMAECVVFGEMTRQIREDAEMIISAVRRENPSKSAKLGDF